MKTLAVITFIAIQSGPIYAETPAQACRREMHERIKKLDARMRDGYKAAEGNRLNALHRELESIRAGCDKKPSGWKNASR